ncbi:MAG: polymerase, partial [Dehalococcoidia bacterium]|nr:polymerase [Dehalococcoidia bacterium]
DLMGTADDPEAVVQAFVNLPFVRQVLARGPTRASILVSGGLQVDLRFVEHDSFGSLLQYFTGSKQHNIDLRERGRRQGLKLSEYGITDMASGKLEKFATEETFYRRLGLQYIPPELREAMGEIERAEAATLPNLVEEADMKGDLHVHSEWSDGHDSIKSIALAARERGYEYIAITDHSAGRGIARGLSLERLEQQREEIRRANAEVKGIRVLAGSEVDIRADGSLDMPPEQMGKLDFVVASVHSAMGQDMAQMTRRVVKALESGLIDVLAHPTCRLLKEREPVALDMEAVFQAAARSGVALEINAMPDRLDLKDIHAFRARELGVKLIISTDAHSIAQLGLMRFGIGVAKRAWCEPAHILNTRPLSEFMSLLPQRGRAV